MTCRGSPKRRKKQSLHVTFPFKCMSVNKCYITRGRRRYPSKYYVDFQKQVFSYLADQGYHKASLSLRGNLKFELEVGTSSKLSDLDNFFKGTLDSLVKFFGGTWDDRQVVLIKGTKRLVKKGDEFFTIHLTKVRRKI